MAAKKKKTPVARKKKVVRKAPVKKKTVTIVSKKVVPAPPPPPPAATSEEIRALATELKARIAELVEKVERLDARVDALATQPEPQTGQGGGGISQDSLRPLSEPMAAFVRAYKENQEVRQQAEAMTSWAWLVMVVLVVLAGLIALVGGKLSNDAVAIVITAVFVTAGVQVVRHFSRLRDD
jgi:hypothetical protein